MTAAKQFDSMFYPRVIQDEFSKTNNAVHAVIEERKRRAKEKTRLEEIEKKKKEALEAAAKKLDDKKNQAKTNTLALIATNAAVLRQGNSNCGRVLRSSTETEAEENQVEVCNFCYCSSYFFG